LNSSFKGLTIGYTLHSSIKLLLFLLRKFKLFLKNPFLILQVLISKDNLKFAMFPAVYNFVL